MFRTFFKSLPFGPLALSLFLAAFLTPFARDGGRFLHWMNTRHGEVIADLQASFGADLSALGPHIEIPSLPEKMADGTLQPGSSLIRLYPSDLKIEIDLTSQVVNREGFRVRWMHADIRLTARFSEPAGMPDYFGPGGGPDWSLAVLRLPFPGPQSLFSHPEVSLEGQTWRLEQTYGPKNHLTLDRSVPSLPVGDVVIAYRRTGIGPAIVIGSNGVRNQVYLSADFPLERFSGPLPQDVHNSIFGSDWSWSVDRSASFDGVSDTTVTKEADGSEEFLGMSFTEPDETGDISLFSAMTRPVFGNIVVRVSFVPLTFALAAFVVFFCRVPGVWPQLGLVLVSASGLAAALFVMQRYGDMAGWSAGAAMAALGTGLVLKPYGKRTAVMAAAAVALAWIALLYFVPGPVDPNEVPVALVVLTLGQPAVFALSVLAAVIALVRATLRYFGGRSVKA